MIHRILAVAENAWVGLLKKKVLYVLGATVLFGFILPLFIQHKWIMFSTVGYQAEVAKQDSILMFSKLVLYVGLLVSILLATSSVETEVSKQTLSSVLIRPLHRWEYLAGRLLSTFGLFLCFVATVVACAFISGFILDCSLPDAFLWGVIQRVCKGFVLITIGFSLGALFSSATALIVLMVWAVLGFLVPQASNEIHWLIPPIKSLFHYLTPSTWTQDFFQRLVLQEVETSLVLMNLGIVGENLMYGIAVFMGAAWLFGKGDLRLREQ